MKIKLCHFLLIAITSELCRYLKCHKDSVVITSCKIILIIFSIKPEIIEDEVDTTEFKVEEDCLGTYPPVKFEHNLSE